MKASQQHLFVVMSVFASASVLSGCEQPYSLAKIQSGSPGAAVSGRPEVFTGNKPAPVVLPTPATPVTPVAPVAPVAPVIPVTPVVTAPATEVASESFKAATNDVKKIDFLFVVDNSGSMKDNQRKLAQGFQEFANTFYRRADLDICTMIITTDRYMGKVGEREYERERTLPCTKPQGSEKWTPAQMQTHIDSLIEEFEEKIYVGVYGSGQELPGKSLVSFLYGLPQWGDRVEQGQKSSFFRKDAVANISFLTDENNFFFDGAATDENVNDLPYSVGAAIPDAKNGEKDARKGLKQYIDEYFSSVNPGRAPTYSVTSLIELNRPVDTIPGLAVNLDQLPASVGRESTKADISGAVETYTQVYQSIADAIVLRASSFTLARAVAGDLNVRIRHAGGNTVSLVANRDFSLQSGNVLTLNPRVLPILKAGDFVDVTYRYTVK
jgi:hypothetical protein